MPIRRALAALALVTVAATPAASQVMTFNALAEPNTAWPPACYAESGFSVTVLGYACGTTGMLGIWGPGDGYAAPDVAMFNNYGGEVVRFTAQGGGTFALTSVDLFAIYGPGTGGTTTVTFTGTYANSTTTQQSFTFDNAIIDYYTAVLDGTFVDLVAADLQVTAGGQRGWTQFDNVTFNGAVTAAPEPGTVALLASGLLAVAGVAGRRRRTR